MNIHYFLKKTVKILIAVTVTITIVLTPLMLTVTSKGDGKLVPSFELQKALALLNISNLNNQQLNVSYSSGYLVMTITGNLTDVSLISTLYIGFQLPDELSGVFSSFPTESHIDYEVGSSVSGTISSGQLDLYPNTKTVAGSVFSLLGLNVGTPVTATLSIPISSFPAIPDGSLQFYGVVTKQSLIDINISDSDASSKQIAIPPPTIDRVTDVSTTITGTGVSGDNVHLVTSGGSYDAVVNVSNSYSVTLSQPLIAESTVTATQTGPEGFTSVGYSRTVERTVLEFFAVPANIPFQTTPFQFNYVTIPKVSSLSITVRDTRGNGFHWKIKAEATGPLTSSSGLSLGSDALVYENGTNEEPLVGKQVLVYSGTTQDSEETTVQWDADKGVLIKMTPEDFLNVVPGDVYSTTINWTLEDTP